jgi:hypothetical protein
MEWTQAGGATPPAFLSGLATLAARMISVLNAPVRWVSNSVILQAHVSHLLTDVLPGAYGFQLLLAAT